VSELRFAAIRRILENFQVQCHRPHVLADRKRFQLLASFIHMQEKYKVHVKRKDTMKGHR
jgi:hypothetical protein